MMLPIYRIITFITGYGSWLLGLFVFLRGPGRSVNRSWFFFCFSVGAWTLGYAATMVSNIDLESALFFSRLSHAWGAVIPALFLNFVILWMELKTIPKYIVRYCHISCLALFILSLTPFIVTDLAPKMVFQYYPVGKLGYVIYVINFIWWVIFAHYYLIRKFLTLHGYKKNQMQYLLIGTVLGYFGGSTCFPLIFDIHIPPYPTVLISIYIATTTYAILRYRLLDISLAVTRTGIFIAVYSLVLGIPFAVAFGWQARLMMAFDGLWWMAPLVISTVLATVGPFLYLYIDKKAEQKLFEEQIRYQTTLKQASSGMGRIKNLDRLINLIVHIVARTVRIEHCILYLDRKNTKKFMCGARRSRMVHFTPKESISKDSLVIQELCRTHAPILIEEIRHISQDSGDHKFSLLENELNELQATMVVPSFIDDRLLAVIVLGEKISRQPYTEGDVAVFSILSNQAALAIENAMFYDEMKETHEQLFKAEKMATIGTMADGLSHQINNRLHALGFIAGDALDTIKMKKDLAMPEELREVMVDLEHALTRIQDNVAQGGDVVQGLLKYTRKGEEGFSDIKLEDLINAAIEMTQFKIKPGELNIVRNFDASLPLINGNFTQLQEVFFNLIDNAYDAMKQRRDDLREKDFQPTITISAQENGRMLKILFSDNGVGIKDEDQDKLFTPFFTTKLSSKKGTGLGLYVIQKLIEENHKGQVKYTSKYLEGTMVHISLPLGLGDKQNN